MMYSDSFLVPHLWFQWLMGFECFSWIYRYTKLESMWIFMRRAPFRWIELRIILHPQRSTTCSSNIRGSTQTFSRPTMAHQFWRLPGSSRIHKQHWNTCGSPSLLSLFYRMVDAAIAADDDDDGFMWIHTIHTAYISIWLNMDLWFRKAQLDL